MREEDCRQSRSRRAGGLVLAVVVVLVSMNLSMNLAWAQAPCSQCGAGPHFVDLCGPFPPPGVDAIANNGALVGIDVNFDCVRDVNLVLSPCLAPNNVTKVLKLQGPIDDSTFFPGTSPLDGHLDVIDTELASMCLAGGGARLVAGASGPSVHTLRQTHGAVAEDILTPDPTVANSFFDVFFEVQGPFGLAYNLQALRVRSRITCLPPKSNYIHPPPPLCVPLYTAGTCAGGPNNGHPCVYDEECPGGGICTGRTIVGNLVAANHSVNEPVCTQAPLPQCDGNCPPGEVCRPGTPPNQCTCVPIPCPQSPFPDCAGGCPPGTECRATATGAACQCVPTQCQFSPFPECQGPCPAPQVCRPDPATGACRCVDPPSCPQSPFPTCQGPCPNPGETCVPDNVNGICRCAPPPCPQSPFPQCNGQCPTGQICQPNPDGTQGCTCLPPQCQQTFPQCNGPCPPGQTCMAGATACFCQPTPTCDLSPYPQCQGQCPAPLVCVPDNSADPPKCRCVEPTPPCQQSPFPQCQGGCPPNLICVPSPLGVCQCVTPPPCQQSPFPQCQGTCPSPLICTPLPTGGCQCVQPPCQQSPFPQCQGPCPAPLVCVATPTGGCQCVQPPCEQSPFPQCQGTCPAPLVCVPSAAGGCQCVQPPCEQSPFPQCQGTCPAPLVCVPSAAGGCQCVQPSCEQSPFPQCQAPCPIDSTCVPDISGNGCRCRKRCEVGPFPECSGTCPPGTICEPTPQGCRCVPAPPPCTASPFPTCGGSCPPGQTCRRLIGGGCQCVPCDSVPPPEVHGVLWPTKTRMIWARVECAKVYNVYRQTAASLVDADHNGVADFYGNCFAPNLPNNEVTDASAPGAGNTSYYLVTAENGAGEGTMGSASNGLPRPNVAPCP